jgi:hypothetical protein
MEKYTFTREIQKKMALLILQDMAIAVSMESVIDPEYFDEPSISLIVAKGLEFYKKYRSSPSQDEFTEFVRSDVGDDIIGEIESLYELNIKNPKMLIDMMVEFAQFKSLREAILESSDLVSDKENRSQIQKIIGDAMKVGMDTRELGVNLITGLQDRYINRLKYGIDADRVSTGLRNLDRTIGGGPAPGELAMIMAPPKGFKSGTLVNIGAGAISQRLKVLEYTLELSQRRVTERYERRFGGIGKKQLISGYDRIENVLRRVEIIGGGLIVKEFPQKKATIDDLYNHTEFVISEGFVPDMLIIDYGDLIKPLGGRELRHQLSDIWSGMRAMAQEFKIPVWTASQVNRKAVNKKVIRMEDIAEAFDKIAICDIAIALCQTIEEKELSLGRFFTAANREDTQGGIAYVKIDYDKMRIRPYKKTRSDDD